MCLNVTQFQRTARMRMEKMSQKALERKSNKPIMEKKRRARINHCLNQLKSLILETDNERSRHSKLEKADILEMTVRYLQTIRAYHLQLHHLQLQQQQQQHHQQSPLHHFQQATQQVAQQQQQHLLPAKLQLQLPLQLTHNSQQSPQQQISPAWRPW